MTKLLYNKFHTQIIYQLAKI